MRRALSLLLLLPVLSGCLGVGSTTSIVVRAEAVNLAFGGEAVPLVSAPEPQVQPSLAQFPTGSLGSFVLPPAGGKPPEPCPAAGPDSFPKDPAGPDLDQQPAAGVYRWRQSGGLAVSADPRTPGTPAAIPDNFGPPRTLHQVGQDTAPPYSTNPGAYHFTVTGGPFAALGFANLSSTYAGVPRSTDPNPVDTGVLPVQQGSSIDGVYLTDLSFSYGASFVFHSPAGVQLFQAPARNGLSWQSSASDPADQTTIAFNGGINPSLSTTSDGKVRINACGDVVEAWQVTGTLTLTRGNPQPGVLTSNAILLQDMVELDIVPQYGGWIAHEHDVFTTAQMGLIDATNTYLDAYLGGLTPAPLPKGTT